MSSGLLAHIGCKEIFKAEVPGRVAIRHGVKNGFFLHFQELGEPLDALIPVGMVHAVGVPQQEPAVGVPLDKVPADFLHAVRQAVLCIIIGGVVILACPVNRCINVVYQAAVA